MSRLNYADDEEFSGQFALWDANCQRSLHGKRGQGALKRLEAALVAMPAKRLIREAISEIDENEARLDVCALGVLAMMEGRDDLLYGDGGDDAEEAGVALGFPRLVAWKVVAQNDVVFDDRHLVREYGPVQYEWQTYRHMNLVSVAFTPEERYDAMLAWVRSQILPKQTISADT